MAQSDLTPELRASAYDDPPYDGYAEFETEQLAACAAYLHARDPVSVAARKLSGWVLRTPVVRNASLNHRTGLDLWTKAESLQHVGAFKARGALFTALNMSAERVRHGLVTYSSGNHGQAVAYAARVLGVEATVAMPVDAPSIKRDAIEAMGGTTVDGGPDSLSRRSVARDIARTRGAAMIPPFDHPHVIAGQATATRELLDEVEQAGTRLDALLVPCGGGGLIAGACLALAEFEKRRDDGRPSPLLFSVEPHGCDALAQSLAAGELRQVDPGATLADGLKPTMVGALNFALVRAHQPACTPLHVDDEQIAHAVACAVQWAKLVLEPSGAATLAAALHHSDAIRSALTRAGRLDAQGQDQRPLRIGLIASGGNIDPAVLMRCLEGFRDQAPS